MTGPEKTTTPVLVVGAGPTGLMMAGELARFGVPCRIIDKAPHPSKVSKAIAVQARTLEVFARIGLADRAIAAGQPIHGMSAYSGGKRIVHISFDGIDSPYPFVLSVSQQETERLLLENLEQRGVPVERNVELVSFTHGEQHVEAVLRHTRNLAPPPEGFEDSAFKAAALSGAEERVVTPWLLGCDGAHSAVRHHANIPFSGSAYPENFALADLTVEGSLPGDEFTLYLGHGALVGLIPMKGNNHYRLIIQQGDAPQQDNEPTLDEFQRALDGCGRTDLRASNPLWMARFRISQRLVSHYRAGRIFLAGDAAHIHSPAGGQGMNTGLQDACNLAWKLALVIHGRARPELLDSYDKERHPVGQTLLRSTGGVFQAVLWRNPVAQAIRDRIASILTSFDAVQDRIRRGVSETGIAYRHSPIVQEDRPSLAGRFAGWLSSSTGPRAGDRAVDAPLQKPDGSPVQLFGILSAPRHALLLFTGWRGAVEDTARRQGLLDAIRRDFPADIAAFVIGGETAPPATSPSAEVLLDPSGAAHRAYGADDEILYLIRPDGYVGYRAGPPDEGKLRAYLKRILL